MYAVGAEALGESDVVVDDEGGVVRGADRLQRLGEARRLMLVEPLDTELERRDRGSAQRFFEARGEGATDVERRDEIELARDASVLGHGGVIAMRLAARKSRSCRRAPTSPSPCGSFRAAP
jgi:hypothetical protein